MLAGVPATQDTEETIMSFLIRATVFNYATVLNESTHYCTNILACESVKLFAMLPQRLEEPIRIFMFF